MRKLLVPFICIALSIGACGRKTEPSFNIVPDHCTISAGEELPISLKGTNIPADGEITWSATKGDFNPSTGFSVTYIAPQEPGAVIITAELITNNLRYSETLNCEVTEQGATTGMEIEIPSPLPSPPTSTPTEAGKNDTIAITEVMSTPCGESGGTIPNRNEYIELYNYGDAPVDVRNWWIATTGGGDGTPDQIVSWKFANPSVSLGSNVIVNETIIPPGKFAVILPPTYYIGGGKYHMPYAFPKDTIILSFSTSKYLGNDTTGLVGYDGVLTTIVLYRGTNSIISKVISTYGTPVYGSSPSNVEDNKTDRFPYPLQVCHSIERIVDSGPDQVTNWREIDAGSPGTK